eukprot:scaffold38615_cov155-Skeletonema_dohrnii-CCMP3373.AAC.4
MGSIRFNDGDYETAFEYWTKATGLRDVGSHYNLSLLYKKGLGVEKDKKNQLHHLEAAAIGGDHVERNDLAIVEWNNGKHERAIKHWIIAATLGDDNAAKYLRERYVGGLVCKEDLLLLFGHIRQPLMQQKVYRGRQPQNMRFVTISMAKAARRVSHEGGGRGCSGARHDTKSR